jgi:hypothetical protein
VALQDDLYPGAPKWWRAMFDAPTVTQAFIPSGSLTQHFHLHPDDVENIARRVVERLKEKTP